VGYDAEQRSVRFEPLRAASRRRLIAGLILGPVIWLVALMIVAYLLQDSWAIEAGLLITLGAFVIAFAVLAILRQGRIRQERRYVEGG
jgi:ABC-type Na+ efflux pump permease subunit